MVLFSCLVVAGDRDPDLRRVERPHVDSREVAADHERGLVRRVAFSEVEIENPLSGSELSLAPTASWPVFRDR